ncbi:MAG: AbrB/MazE/SpoVT family DNA-binding domain-containing protein [Syntrophorhabdales bacterium]|jgi:AbrB family looped-hinge helix DNA binding protein
MPWARVLRSGQVTFPKEVRESLNLKEGDIVDFQIKGSEVVIRPKVMIDKGKAEVWKMFDEMHEKMKDEDPQKIGKLIDEAVKETKKQRTAKKARRRG